jgi:hypothetical protein
MLDQSCQCAIVGDVIQLRVISGATITPLVDEQGFVPLSPNPAYQQVILGLPISNLTAATVDPATLDNPQSKTQPKTIKLSADQLIYSPRNPRPYTRWGCSPVERIIVHVGHCF